MNENYDRLFYQRLMRKVKQTGKYLNEIERDLGYPRNALSNYRMGSKPSV
ncbi:hypothetical protein ABLU29_00230 (plasmid) [Lactococcus lactis]